MTGVPHRRYLPHKYLYIERSESQYEVYLANDCDLFHFATTKKVPAGKFSIFRNLFDSPLCLVFASQISPIIVFVSLIIIYYIFVARISEFNN